MAGVRRLLEEDLEFKKYSLDPHKAFIGEQLEKVSQMAIKMMFPSAKNFS